MKTTNFFAIASLSVLFSFASSDIFSQSSEDLMGRWEGVHYYGDTTRLYDGTMIVRASTIDSMRMILMIERFQGGKFTGKLHEHFYSDPAGSYFNADVSGFIKGEKIHFDSFRLKEKKMPPGNRWCQPKATGVLVKKENVFSLNMFFESTLTCTIGPAILEKKASPVVTTTPAEPPQNDTVNSQPKISALNPQQKDSVSIAEKFRKRNRSVTSTISVQSDSIKINFLDNSVVDGDSISVFINGKLTAAHVRLTAKVFTLNVHFEKGQNEIEVAMFAENLGTLPPNTALMQIVDGSKVHRAYLSSDTISNAVIRIRRIR
jgi:hypothetical protein